MHMFIRCAIPLLGIAAAASTAPVHAQHEHHGADTTAHAMATFQLGGGWRITGMGQLFPILTVGAPGGAPGPLRETEAYLTQPVVMANLIGPDARIALRATLDLEGMTQPDGELTFGGWGEGFLDRRHPHTLLHELMLSYNLWDLAGGALSLSAGKGFAPYGTPDPMSRPALKYPTNHHLSQILERWTVGGAFVRAGWSLEAGVFAGAEPEGPYDLDNFDGFGESWSARLSRYWGGGTAPMSAWEASISFGSVSEDHDGEAERTSLWNAFLRHTRATPDGEVYTLVEASHSDPEHGDGYFSALLESRLTAGRHRPHVRLEYATRPEYERDGPSGSEDFFRYDHDAQPIGATRWLIATAAYGYELSDLPVSVRPFVDVQYHSVRAERGPVDPRALFGARSFWAISAGARVFLGGDPMRMGGYGVLDAMTNMER